MGKYWIKNRFFLDAIIAIILSLLFCFAFVFPEHSKIVKIENQNKIYLNSEIDYQIPNPSKEQLDEIKSKSFVSETFGYYLSKTTIKASKTAKVNLIMSDNMDRLGMTMYNEKTLLKSITNVDNYAYVDKTAADLLEIDCGDDIIVVVANNELRFTICAIYESNSLFSDGAVLVDFSGDIKSVYEENVSSNSYSGAFIKANNRPECDLYLKEYIPLGRLKERSDFDSDEAYNNYNDAILSGNYTNEITNFGGYRDLSTNELESATKYLSLMAYIGAFIVALACLITNLVLRNRKSEKKYFKDVLKNKKSVSKYRFYSFFVNEFLYCACSLILLWILDTFVLVIIPFIISLASFIIAFIVNLILDKSYIVAKGK